MIGTTVVPIIFAIHLTVVPIKLAICMMVVLITFAFCQRSIEQSLGKEKIRTGPVQSICYTKL